MKIWNSNIHIHLNLDGWSRKLVLFEQIFVHILMDISDIKSNLCFSYWFYYLVNNFGCKKCEVTVKNRREVVYSKTKMVYSNLLNFTTV